MSDIPLVSDTSCWSSNTNMETEISDLLYRNTRGSEGGKCVPCPLRPAPLFRSIGLTGLSASLPPHRRLRSILHRVRAVRPDNTANETNESESGTNASTVISVTSDSGVSFKHFLPDITQKLHQSQTHQETRRRGSRSTGEMETFSNFQSGLNPNNHLAFQRHHSMGYRDPPSKPYTSRRTIVFPVTQSDTYSAITTETPLSTNRKRWSRKIRQILTSEKGSDEPDISECFHSLVITDDRSSPNMKNTQASGSPKSNRSQLDSESGGKRTCHTRRDRRPHFLPPISKSGCLLNVPFILPENSPPPSPSSVFSTPFFPLNVPALSVHPQCGQRDT